MSAVAPAPRPTGARGRRPVAPPPPPAPPGWRASVERLNTDVALTAVLTLLLCGACFIADGGQRLAPTTWVEVLCILLGFGLATYALVRPSRGTPVPGPHGALALAGFVALAAVTALSIVWAVNPNAAWVEANRTLSYLAVFAAGMALVRLAPGRWPSVLHAIALSAVIVCGYAVLTKVFPASLAADETFARLRVPYGYWNATGLTAVLGVFPLLWLAARRDGAPALSAVAWPALFILLLANLLAYSRGSLMALAVGLVLWFALVPLRLRASAALASALGLAVLVATFAFTNSGLADDGADLAERTDGGHQLGVLVLFCVAALLVAGAVVGHRRTRRPLRHEARVLAGRIAAGAIVALLLVGIVALAGKPGGVDGQLESAYDDLTSQQTPPPSNDPGRLTATASVRAKYWVEAIDVFDARPGIGAGAGGYETARLRFRDGVYRVRHAHGYGVQTMADLGLLGVAVSLLAAIGWLLAAVRTLGLRARDRLRPWDPERVGVTTLAALVVCFGVHSMIDWTWFIPGNAIPVVLAAGWVAGRGPIRPRDPELAPAPGSGTGTAVAGTLVEPGARYDPGRTRFPRWSDTGRRARRGWRPDPIRAPLGVLVALLGLATAWAVVQPLRSAHAGEEAVRRSELGLYDQAATIALVAAERNPTAVEPYYQLAAIQEGAQDLPGAQRALEEAVRLQPANAEPWERLGAFRLRVLRQPGPAAEALRAAVFLDPQSRTASAALVEATRLAASPTSAPPVAPSPVVPTPVVP